MNISRNMMYFVVILSLLAIGYAIRSQSGVHQVVGPVSNNVVDSVETVPKVEDSFYYTGPTNEVQNSLPTHSLATSTIAPERSDGITSKAFIVGNMRTGEIYLSYNSRLALSIASMSKLMTAYIGLTTLTPTTTIQISEDNTKVFPDQSNLQSGEVFAFSEILYPLLLNSSNVAAEAIASTYGRIAFLELMSSSAWEIGLPTTYFTDPSGLSPNNRASAQGFFELTKYIYETKRELLDVTKVVELDVATTTEHGSHRFVNIHPFVKDPRFLGGKTGRTPEAGDTMLTILNIGGEPVAFIVLGGAYDKRKADTDILINKLAEQISDVQKNPVFSVRN